MCFIFSHNLSLETIRWATLEFLHVWGDGSAIENKAGVSRSISREGRNMASSASTAEREVLAFLSEWWITTAVVVSLIMQLLLLLTGGTRKWNEACQFVAWSAYNMSDYVATAALGALAQGAAGSGKAVYAIWAPMLLLHLGAPDNIAAYAMEDAELWVRHGLTMVLQVATAVYVVANTARGWNYVVGSVCITAVGSFKYAERTLALKRASRAAIVESALPIYTYMRLEPYISLSIKGDNKPSSSTPSVPAPQAAGTQGDQPSSSTPSVLAPQAAGTEGDHQPSSSTPSVPAPQPSSSTPSVPAPQAARDRYYYIIRGEEKWYQNLILEQAYNSNQDDQEKFENAARRTSELVTLQDILSSQQLRQTPNIMFLCLGFALFKLFKRRITNLYLYEWRQNKTRQLFQLETGSIIFENENDIISVLDVELRFLFDSLYTKSAGTAFSKSGIVFRILTTILLLASGIFILKAHPDLQHQAILVKQADNVTILLLVAALVIELYQLARLALSDWATVWLACTYITVSENRYANCYKGLWPAALLKMIMLSSSFRRRKYWRSRIGQYDMVNALYPNFKLQFMKYGKQAGLFPHDLLQLLPRYEETPQVVIDFKSYVLRKVLASYCHGASQSPSQVWWFFPKYTPSHQLILQAARCTSTDLEHFLVNWHVATSVCELLTDTDSVVAGSFAPEASNEGNISSADRSNQQQSAENTAHREAELPEDLRMSKILSRYLGYLLVHKAELLPCHADIARQLAAETQEELRGLKWTPKEINQRISQDIDADQHISKNLKEGMKAGKLLQALPSMETRWRLIADVWVDILIFAAAPNKSTEHMKQLTGGGEFLTHVWLLLGHIGFALQ